MEFPFNLNHILLEDISLLTSKDVAVETQTNYYQHKDNVNLQLKKNLSKIIDAIGEASSKAQKLRGAITSALKLKSSDHHLYMLKDSSPSNELGSIIGIIRVGYKRLFLADIYGQLYECQPLCVLDFYVHESKQRHGFGKRLFEYMIKVEGKEPHQVAIDRPSPKFISFLEKHFNLRQPINQMNKFVVFESFFKDLTAVGAINVNRRRSAPGHRKIMNLHIEPRMSNSATSSNNRLRRSNRIQNPTNELSKFQLIPPINRKVESDVSTVSDTSNITESSDKLLSSRIAGSYQMRRNLCDGNTESKTTNAYSRHSTGNQCTAAPPRVQESNQKKSNFSSICNIKTHTIESTASDRNITSLDNPFSNERRIPRFSQESSSNVKSTNSDKNYSVNGILSEYSANSKKLGTGWSVLGVPSGNLNTRNPYSRIKKR